MLDQENQANVEPSTLTTNNNNSSSNNNKLSNCNPAKAHTNPLDDHDYCTSKDTSHLVKPLDKESTNTNSSSPVISSHVQNQKTIDNSRDGDDQRSQSTLSASECPASTSSSPRENHSKNNGTIGQIHLKEALNDDDDNNLSDSSSSSSSISSDDSTKNLVIAQESSRVRSLAPKDTPSVSKPKLGRRPLLKTQFEATKAQPQSQKDQQARTRRPRQNTSVTEKSQWITGEEQVDSALSAHLNTNQREKRQRKEVHDPEFSHFTSSEYSSSDAESDQESDADSVDDPNRPWCVCNQPDDGNFMIECEICKYWFHGSCVGFTKSLSERWEKEGREWYCSNCDHALQSGTPKDAIPPRIVKKEKKIKTKTKKRRGRPRKSLDHSTREVTTRQSLRSAKKQANASFDSKTGNKPKSNARVESFEKFDDSTRLKELIRERRKAFFQKHRLSEQLKEDKVKKMGLGRHSVTGTLGNSLDSLASETNSPNMNNLPINIKSDIKERSKLNIVIQINKKDGSAESSGKRVAIVKKRRHSEVPEPVVNEKPQTSTPPTEPAIKEEKESKSVLDTLAFLDSTECHGDHIFDMNCKICTKQPSATVPEKNGASTKSPDTNEVKVEKDQQSKVEEQIEDQPKRMRISIDTKIDPASLSRLTEPLIQPEQPSDSVEYNLSKLSPNAAAMAKDESEGQPDDMNVDDLYDPETSVIPPNVSMLADKQSSNASSIDSRYCWSGTISMSEVGKFSSSARPISGNLDFMQSEVSQTLMICGRIAHDQLNSYIKKLKTSTKNQVLLVQLHPQNETDKSSFNTFFDYLYTRNRCAVVNTSSQSHVLKDFYILPIHENGRIPDILKPMNEALLDRKDPNCLLGLLVKLNRPSSAASSTSSYTPTTIK